MLEYHVGKQPLLLHMKGNFAIGKLLLFRLSYNSNLVFIDWGVQSTWRKIDLSRVTDKLYDVTHIKVYNEYTSPRSRVDWWLVLIVYVDVNSTTMRTMPKKIPSKIRMAVLD
jgi:hypothetical protein